MVGLRVQQIGKLFLSIILCVGTMELWSRYRFDLQSEHVPWDMRENIAMTALDAKKLKSNFDGISRRNIAFYTNEFGFRCSKDRANVKPEFGVVLGGDSFTFGMYHPYEESWPYFFEQALRASGDLRWAHVQAIPGGSPYMTLDHLFEVDHVAERVPANLLLQSISHYDHVDNALYKQDKMDQLDPSRAQLRWLKVKLAPYLVSMLQIKLRHFMQKDERKQLLFADDYSVAGKARLMKEVLTLLKTHCAEQGWSFALFFMPNESELLAKGWAQVTPLEEQANELNIPFYNLEKDLETDSSIELNNVFRDDHLHLNVYGAKVVGQKLAEFVKATGL